MTTPTAASAMSARMPASHLAQLDAIDEAYWWHRVRWRITRRAIQRYDARARFACYFDIGSGGGGLPRLLAQDFTFGEVRLFDQHEAQATKRQAGTTQHVVDLETCAWITYPRPELVTCLDVLEHLLDPARLLREVRAHAGAARPLLIVTVPAMPSLWSSWDEQAGHYRRYTRRSLVRLLEEAGWTVRECSYVFRGVVPLLWLQRRCWWRNSARPGRHVGQAGARVRSAVEGRAEGPPGELVFPMVPGWLNAVLERGFWWEFLATRWLSVPVGSSLVAVAQPRAPDGGSDELTRG